MIDKLFNDDKFYNSLKIFLTKNWIIASQEEKQQAFEFIEKEIAQALRRPERKIIIEDLGEEYGGFYTKKDDVIRINARAINSQKKLSEFDAMEIILHEVQHVNQFDTCRNVIKYENKDRIQVEIWTKNLIAYLDFKDYGMEISQTQPLEKNASEFAAKFTDVFFENLLDRFKNELGEKQLELQQKDFSEYKHEREKTKNDIVDYLTNEYGSNYELMIFNVINKQYLIKIKNSINSTQNLYMLINDVFKLKQDDNKTELIRIINNNNHERSLDEIINNIVNQKENSNRQLTHMNNKDDQSLDAIINNIKAQTQDSQQIKDSIDSVRVGRMK